MTPLELKTQIERSIMAFSQGNFRENGILLLKSLGYSSDRQVTIEPNTFAGFVEVHPPLASINKKKALVDNWLSVDILFQLTGEDLRQMTQGRLIFDKNRIDNQIIESYLFLAIELKPENYSRTKLADITREVNKFFAMPVLILFKIGESLTLSIINRRLHKIDESKDVLEKVTLIKGISIKNPIRAHVEILFDLSLPELVTSGEMHSFVELHRAWQKTLDISELNKRFYREIANWYFYAVEHVEFPKGTTEDRQTRNATNIIRLITRLIFVWFIKEKGLVPDALFNPSQLKEILNFNDPQSSTYYKAILQNLFFATLNTEMGSDRRFRGKNKNPNGMDAHHGISTVYRYEDFFKDPAKGLALFAGIPFLNGGLFECLDKREEKILVDGFSDDPRNQPVIPDSLFFGDELTVDLSEVYGDKHHNKEKVRGLIRIFDSYKFTIEENTPLDEEIALDPELLGKVFENLLAAYNPETGTTARKQTGSFYTPREIVNYMVDESLIAYLENSLGGDELNDDEKSLLESKLRHLLAYNNEPHRFSAGEAEQIISAIDKVKVLDPACGSGAFPMGVLHKLVFILNKLDPGNVKWKERQLAKAAEIPDATVREQVIEDIEKSFTENELDYGRKLYLIENCIYGVDIQPIAVQIAKLRFFISLVVDQTVDRAKLNLGIRPLPNLESKFVAANTLIGIEKPQQMLLHNPVIDEKEKQLAEVRDSLFTARTPATKRKYREMDKQLREEIAKLLKSDGWSNVTATQLANWDPYNQNASAAFFDPEWMFGNPRGFDIVLGNPPYGANFTKDEKALYTRIFHHQNYQLDSYLLFLEKSFDFLVVKGFLGFIIPNTWLINLKLKNIRKFMTEQNTIVEINHYSKKVFEAVVDTDALLAQKGYFGNSIVKIRIYFENNRSIFNEVNQEEWKILNGEPINVFRTKRDNAIIFKIQQKTSPLGEICDVAAGINPYEIGAGDPPQTVEMVKNRVYDATFKKDPSYVPLLRGKDIEKYVTKWDGTRWIKYGKNLAAPRKIQNYNAHQKIVIRQTGDSLIATLDDAQFYCLKNMHTINLKDGKYDLRYILGLINSRLLNYYFQMLNPEQGETLAEVKKENVAKLPIFLASKEQQLPIICLVDQILHTKRGNRGFDTTLLEDQVDRLVYELYGLEESEITSLESQSKSIDNPNDYNFSDVEPPNIIDPKNLFEIARPELKSDEPEVTPGDYGLYKCSICGRLVTGFMKDDHAQEKHRGATVEWKKISG